MKTALIGSAILLALFMVGSMKSVERPLPPLSVPPQELLDELSPRAEYVMVPGNCPGVVFTYDLNK